MRKAARRSCELANTVQVRQIASQTGVLFSAGCGLLQAGTPLRRGWPRRRGETVAGRDAVAERLAVRAVAQKHREEASSKRVLYWQLGAWLASACRVTFVWVVR